jgi:sporulation protein YlmC with PRC-barrel domain
MNNHASAPCARQSSGVAFEYIAAVTISVFVALLSPPVHAQDVTLVLVKVETVAKGYSLRQLTGTSVVNDQSQKIGTIDDFVIGRDGKVFAVLQVGGFLHMGGHRVAVPYDNLVFDPSGKQVRLPGASEDELKKLPEYKPSA